MAETETDYYLQDFQIVNVDNSRGQVYQLSGQSLSHYQGEGNSSISQPSIKVFGANKTNWKGSAQRGDISSDFRQLTLIGAVQLSQYPSLPSDLDPALAQTVDKASVAISTASVRIDTAQQTIVTEDPVTIKSEHWSLKANQMQADIDDSKLFFDSGMEAEYFLQE